MRADELMIGDWVLNGCGNPIQVKELLEDGINGEWDGAECDGVEAVYDDIKPIFVLPTLSISTSISGCLTADTICSITLRKFFSEMSLAFMLPTIVLPFA